MKDPAVIQDFVSEKVRSRKTIAANLATDEFASVSAIINWRKAKGITQDNAHFIRQLLHFVINKEYLQGYDFLLPRSEEYQSLLPPANTPDDEHPQPTTAEEHFTPGA